MLGFAQPNLRILVSLWLILFPLLIVLLPQVFFQTGITTHLVVQASCGTGILPVTGKMPVPRALVSLWLILFPVLIKQRRQIYR